MVNFQQNMEPSRTKHVLLSSVLLGWRHHQGAAVLWVLVFKFLSPQWGCSAQASWGCTLSSEPCHLNAVGPLEGAMHVDWTPPQ